MKERDTERGRQRERETETERDREKEVDIEIKRKVSKIQGPQKLSSLKSLKIQNPLVQRYWGFSSCNHQKWHQNCQECPNRSANNGDMDEITRRWSESVTSM